MRDRTVTFLQSGPGYAYYQIVALYTLRQHYQGHIQLAAYPESLELAERIARDPRLDIEVLPWKPDYTGKNSQFLNKILLCQKKDTEVRVYLDADISIEGNIEPLFDACDDTSFVATQFNQWMSTGGTIERRVGSLLKFDYIPKSWINEILTKGYKYPSPNGGVFACRPESPVLPLWHDCSWQAKSTFICDEAVLHLMQVAFPDSKDFVVLRGGVFNSSFKWQEQVESPVIRHFHGCSAIRIHKCKAATEHWWPIFAECCELNIGGVQEWRLSITNKWIEELRRGEPNFEYRYLYT